jgi:hypothetical protein
MTSTAMYTIGQGPSIVLRSLTLSRALALSLIAGALTSCSDPGPRRIAGPIARDQGHPQFERGARAQVQDFGPDVPLAYYALSLDLMKRTAGFAPPSQARAYAYMGLALYEALVSGMPGDRSVAKQLNGIGPLPEPNGAPYHWPLVANSALAEVMRGLWGDKTSRAADNVAALDALEAHFDAQFADVPPGLAKQSIDFGRAVGAAVYATSMDDGEHEAYLRNFPTTYTPPQGDGLWQPTAPGQLALQPYWGTTMQTFALSSAAECDPGAPPAYSVQPGSAFYNEALEVYNLVRNGTAEQVTIARYWADGTGSFSGPGHSVAIANEILVQQHATLATATETYARVGLALADALTALWWAKFHYNLIRPVTYIQAVIDPTWNTLLPTPPFPEYVSAHSAQSAAATASLEYLFGENVAFVDHAHDADGFTPRAFNRIYAAAEEAGISRLYAGIHFRSGNLRGQWLGRCVAAKVNSLSWRR